MITAKAMPRSRAGIMLLAVTILLVVGAAKCQKAAQPPAPPDWVGSVVLHVSVSGSFAENIMYRQTLDNGYIKRWAEDQQIGITDYGDPGHEGPPGCFSRYATTTGSNNDVNINPIQAIQGDDGVARIKLDAIPNSGAYAGTKAFGSCYSESGQVVPYGGVEVPITAPKDSQGGWTNTQVNLCPTGCGVGTTITATVDLHPTY